MYKIELPFKVISAAEGSGILVDHFHTLREAEAFAEAVSSEGFTASVCQNLRVFQAKEPEPEDFGVRPGVDFPATLSPARGAAQWLPRPAA